MTNFKEFYNYLKKYFNKTLTNFKQSLIIKIVQYRMHFTLKGVSHEKGLYNDRADLRDRYIRNSS